LVDRYDTGRRLWFKENYKALKDGGHLASSIVDLYFGVLSRRAVDVEDPRCLFLPNIVMEQLPINSPEYVPLEVAALNNIDLSTIDMVLTPICEPFHWTLGVINYKHQRFDYYNSLGNPIPATSRAGMRKLAQWIAGRATGSAGAPTTGPPDGDKWKFHRMACPQQQNWIDCGVFACQYANYLSTGRPLWQSEDGSIEGGRLDMLLAFSNEQDWRARSIPPAGAAGG
jgi:hypothetical protein